MSHDEIIAVVQAHKEGKQIQTRPHFHPDKWLDCNPVWDFYQNDYRVEPEPRKPREWWIELRCDGSFIQMFTHSAQLTRGGELVHVREVLKECMS